MNENGIYNGILIDNEGKSYLLSVDETKPNDKEFFVKLFEIEEINRLSQSMILGKEIAHCMFEKKEDSSYYVMYQINNKNYRGKGLGRKLINFSKEFLRKKGAKSIKIDVVERVIESFNGVRVNENLEIYLKNNFKPINSLQDNIIAMECDLVEESYDPTEKYTYLNNLYESKTYKHYMNKIQSKE